MDTQSKNHELTPRHLSRRQMLGLLGGGATIAFSMTCRSSRRSEDSGRTLTDDLVSSSATALAGAIKRKDVSSEEVVRAYLERIEEVNPKLNAIVQTREIRPIK